MVEYTLCMDTTIFVGDREYVFFKVFGINDDVAVPVVFVDSVAVVVAVVKFVLCNITNRQRNNIVFQKPHCEPTDDDDVVDDVVVDAVVVVATTTDCPAVFWTLI